MSDVENLTLEVLKDIRTELRDLKGEVRQTNLRLDKTNERLDSVESSLGKKIDATNQRLTESEVRLATELTAVIGAINDLKRTIVEGLEVKKQVDDHERRLAALEQRPNH